MKVKLSKSQWNDIGKRCGWINKFAQGSQQVPDQQPPLNARQLFIIRIYNNLMGGNIAETQEGYLQSGGSTRMVRDMAKNEQVFLSFISKPEILQLLDDDFRFEVMKGIALKVSRGL